MRRYLSHAFSDRSLQEQEPLITKTIDKFIDRIGQKGNTPKGFDIGKSFEIMTFDIIGDLAFGQNFGGMERGELILLCSQRTSLANSAYLCEDDPHPWISVTLGALTQGALVDVFKRFPTVAGLLMVVVGGKIKKLMKETSTNEEYAIELVNRYVGKT